MLRTLTALALTLAFVIAGAAASTLLIAQEADKDAPEATPEEQPAPALYLGFKTRPAEKGNGMLVLNVVFGSPFQVAGIQPDDVVTMMNGQTVKSAGDVAGAIAGLKPGDEIKVKYERGENSISTNVTLEERHEGMDFALYGITGFEQQVAPKVQSVATGMAAEAAGMQAGDVIVKLNGNTIDNIEQVVGYLGATSPGDRVIFTVQRGEKVVDLTITAGHR